MDKISLLSNTADRATVKVHKETSDTKIFKLTITGDPSENSDTEITLLGKFQGKESSSKVPSPISVPVLAVAWVCDQNASIKVSRGGENVYSFFQPYGNIAFDGSPITAENTNKQHDFEIECTGKCEFWFVVRKDRYQEFDQSVMYGSYDDNTKDGAKVDYPRSPRYKE